MLLSDCDIISRIKSGALSVDPFDSSCVQPSSIDIHLDCQFRVFSNYRYTHIDPSQQQDDLTSLFVPAKGSPFILHPGEFVLGSSFEEFSLPDDLAARLEGKSSLGRLGLLVHSTAGFVDPGFVGRVTLELSNVANLPISLWPGMKIGQICFITLSSHVKNKYGSVQAGSHYQNQSEPLSSRSYDRFSCVDTYPPNI